MFLNSNRITQITCLNDQPGMQKLHRVKLLTLALLVAAVPALALAAVSITQEDTGYQVRYAANLNLGESYINITNTGANGAPLLGPGFGGASGNICVNVYAFDPAEELISCCSCLVTPDQTVNLGVNRDLTSKTLTGVDPTSVTVKLLATLAGTGGSGTSCTNSAATAGTPVSGMAAWGTTLHQTPTGTGSIFIGGNTARTDTWRTETGQSMPTGTAGYIDGTLIAASAGIYTFTYGGGGLVAGDTGHGNDVYTNEFWVGSSESAAVAAGHIFCTLPGDPSCNNAATAVGTQFSISLPAGPIPFGFTFGPTTSNVLLNGGQNDLIGAYLAQMGAGTTASIGPGTVAYLGLTDRPYPGDHDFEDLVVRVSTTSQPYDTTETPFTTSTLSTGELASITGRCASIIGNASGFGICSSCRSGALGGSKF